MVQVLFLTRNIQEDKALRNCLEELGYEVFCSTSMVEKYFKKTVMPPEFPILLLSATLTNDEVTTILRQSYLSNTAVFRCDWSEPDESQLLEWDELGLSSYLSMAASLSALRELLVTYQSNRERHYPKIDGYIPITMESIESVRETFSATEKKLFELLCQENGDFLTRNEVALRLWKSPPTNSNLAQLSQLVRRIRTKLAKKNLPDDLIETHWKKGYRISINLTNCKVFT